MQPAPIPQNEKERLEALYKLGILDTKPDPRFDRYTKYAVKKFGCAISTISIIDKDREWYKSCEGVGEREGKRDISFCGHAMLAESIFIVEDTFKDPRFADNPAVIGKPFIRFYAGVALHDRESGLPIGVFCIKDTKPKKLSNEEIGELISLASKVEDELNLPRNSDQ